MAPNPHKVKDMETVFDVFMAIAMLLALVCMVMAMLEWARPDK